MSDDNRYEKIVTGKTQADGNETVVLADIHPRADHCIEHQVDVYPEGATSGTVAVMIKRRGTSAFIALKDEFGADVVVNLASPATYTFRARITAFRFDPDSVTGGNGEYGFAINGLC